MLRTMDKEEAECHDCFGFVCWRKSVLLLGPIKLVHGRKLSTTSGAKDNIRKQQQLVVLQNASSSLIQRGDIILPNKVNVELLCTARTPTESVGLEDDRSRKCFSCEVCLINRDQT